MWLLTQNRDFPVMKIENNAVLEFDHFPSLQAHLLEGLHPSVSASGLPPTKQKTALVFIRVGAGGGAASRIFYLHWVLQWGCFLAKASKLKEGVGPFHRVISLQKRPQRQDQSASLKPVLQKTSILTQQTGSFHRG